MLRIFFCHSYPILSANILIDIMVLGNSCRRILLAFKLFTMRKEFQVELLIIL